jgi:cytochrome c oxidase cbb3-type subunit IV
MDVITLRSVVTLVSFVVFVGIVLWVYVGKRESDFEEAATSLLKND